MLIIYPTGIHQVPALGQALFLPKGRHSGHGAVCGPQESPFCALLAWGWCYELFSSYPPSHEAESNMLSRKNGPALLPGSMQSREPTLDGLTSPQRHQAVAGSAVAPGPLGGVDSVAS